MIPFVSAVWSDLLIVSYAVSDQAIQPFLPPGREIDRWNGKAHVSLVAFRFQQTRILGLGLPPFLPMGDFPQWNLRFYVKVGEPSEENERGIVFLKEYVPSPLVATAVRRLYHEPYQAAPLACRVTPVGTLRRIRYDLTISGKRHTLAVSARAPAQTPSSGSGEAFFTGQGWGCGRDRAGRSTRFHVTHPPWRVYDIEACDIEVDFDRLYGPAWAFLQDRPPNSVILCEGSAVRVSRCLRG